MKTKKDLSKIKDLAPARMDSLIDYKISQFVRGIAPLKDQEDNLCCVYENTIWLRTEIVKLMKGESHDHIR